MAHQEQLVRVAAIAGDIGLGPGGGRRGVLDEVGKAGVRKDAVVGNDRDHAAGGQDLAHEAVTRPVPAPPAAAIEEHHGGGSPVVMGRRIDIQLPARALAIGQAPERPGATRRSQRKQQRPHQRTTSPDTKPAAMVAAARRCPWPACRPWPKSGTDRPDRPRPRADAAAPRPPRRNHRRHTGRCRRRRRRAARR